MAKDLKISILQLDIAWHDPEKNFQRVLDLSANLDTDILVLPEMYSTGFTMEAEKFSEDLLTQSREFLSQLAKKRNCLVIASCIQKNEGKYYNALYTAFPDGQQYRYNKKHLFSFANEPKHYSPGGEKLMVNYQGWQINPLVCYDLRFPVFCRSTALQRFDIQVFVANWPKARVSAWETLLKARAIENQCFVVGVNRCGEDGNGIEYNGKSVVIDPYGNPICSCEDSKEEVQSCTIQYDDLQAFRKKFPVLEDADPFTLL
ncbi:MAG: nitrilase-related carbon-nitrogen hydrolase [Luteibaculum sp.]